MIARLLRGAALSAVMATSCFAQAETPDLSSFGDEAPVAQPDPAAGACLSRSGIPFEDAKALKTPTGWSDVSAWTGEIFIFAGELDCAAGRVTARDLMMVRGFTRGSDRRADRAIKADEIIMTGAWNSRCGPFSGMGIEAKNIRWFTWSGESSPLDRYYEVIRSNETGKDQRIRTSSHVRIAEMVWSPVESTQCALSGKFAAAEAEVRWRGGDVSRLRSRSVTGNLVVHHPKVALNIEGVRPSQGDVSFSGVEVMNVADKVTANTGSVDFTFGASAPGFAPFSLLISKYVRPVMFGSKAGLESMMRISGADISNALYLSDARFSISAPDIMSEPSVLLPVSMALDFGSAGIARVTGGFSAEARLNGSGMADIAVKTSASQIASADISARLMFRKFEKHVLDDAVSGGRPDIDAAPLVHSISISTKDDGIDAGYLSLTGKTLRDAIGEHAGPGFSGAAYSWMREFRNSGSSSMRMAFTSPLRAGEGFFRSIYSAAGSFSVGG